MSFCWVTLNVKNMKESLKFYQDIIGLQIKREMTPMPGIEIVFLGSSESTTEVELIRNDKNNTPAFGRDISLGFEVESLEKTIDLIKNKGISEIEGPFQPAPYIKFIFINDPNGVKVQFIENIKQ